jgi:glyoxylate utilization-related uncharacterized protein
MQIVDLDGRSGPEVLFTNVRTINGIPQPSTAVVLTYAKREIRSYDVGNTNFLQVADLDGLNGPEVLFTNLRSINGSPQEATAVVLNHSSSSVQSYNIGRPLQMQIVDLDGRSGPEVLFTNVRTINGIPQPSTAVVLTYAKREIRSYDVGTPNSLQVADLDGLNGPEVLFTNLRSINGSPQESTAVVLNHSSSSVQSYNIGRPLQMQIVDLDGRSGPEVLFTNVRTINGIPQSSTAVVLTYATREIRSYNVGTPNSLQVVDLDGLNGPEVLFTNLRSINGSPQEATAVVLNHSSSSVQSYNIGRPLQMQIVNLDGRSGPEVLFTNVRTINGIPQPSTAVVLTYAMREVRSYDVGTPNSLQIVDLDGLNGPEVLFTNLRSINGSPQEATAVVLNHSSRLVQSYNIGRPNNMQIVDLDGVPGAEVVFTATGRKVVLHYRNRTLVTSRL